MDLRQWKDQGGGSGGSGSAFLFADGPAAAIRGGGSAGKGGGCWAQEALPDGWEKRTDVSG